MFVLRQVMQPVQRPVVWPARCNQCCGQCYGLRAVTSAATCYGYCCRLRAVTSAAACGVAWTLWPVLRPVLWPARCGQCCGLWGGLRAAACVVACPLWPLLRPVVWLPRCGHCYGLCAVASAASCSCGQCCSLYCGLLRPILCWRFESTAAVCALRLVLLPLLRRGSRRIWVLYIFSILYAVYAMTN